MFQYLSVEELFPTPLWVIDLDKGPSERLKRDLMHDIHRLTEPREPVGIGGSWQTDPILHRLPEFADFMSLVRKAAKGAVDFLDIEYRGFTVTGSKIPVPVKEGRLVLFPAWLNHSVPVNVSDAERVSISFNIMFTDYTESMSPTLWEKGSAPIRNKARPA